MPNEEHWPRGYCFCLYFPHFSTCISSWQQLIALLLLMCFLCALLQGRATRDEPAARRLPASGVEARAVRLKNLLIDHFAAPAALIAVEVYELATCCCCCSGCCKKDDTAGPSGVLMRHLAKTPKTASGASSNPLPLVYPPRQLCSSNTGSSGTESEEFVSPQRAHPLPSARTQQQRSEQQQQENDGGGRSQRKGLAGYLLKQRTTGRSQQQYVPFQRLYSGWLCG